MSTFNEILSNIRAAVPELTIPENLNSSNTDPLVKIASAIAPNIDNTITEISNSVTVIENLIGNMGYAKAGYVEQKAKEWQPSYTLTSDDDFNPVYEIIDIDDRIIKQASYVRTKTGDNLFYINSIKVAKDDGLGGLIKLTTGEKSAFELYMRTFDTPGSHVQVISDDPNVLNFMGTVTMIEGTSEQNTKTNIANALETFRDEFQFNGKLFVNDIETYLKTNITGIRNVYLNQCSIDSVSFVSDGVTDLSGGYFNYIYSAIDMANALVYETI